MWVVPLEISFRTRRKTPTPGSVQTERNRAPIVNVSNGSASLWRGRGTMRNENALAGKPIPKFHSPNAQSDEALMKAIAAGDQSAMRTLYARHNVRLYHFIARLVTDAGRAEDLVSEVFIDVWRQADRFEGRSQVSTWLLSIARFKTLSALHRRRDTQIDEIDMELIEDSANTPEEVVLNRDRSAQLRICLAQMSRDHREILDLVYYQEKSVEEVAEVIQMPKSTVKTRMFYARKRLAQLLSAHRDFDHLTASWAA
jgi:RNA polymerase sigma-70 factor (ECF subfamily)